MTATQVQIEDSQLDILFKIIIERLKKQKMIGINNRFIIKKWHKIFLSMNINFGDLEGNIIRNANNLARKLEWAFNDRYKEQLKLKQIWIDVKIRTINNKPRWYGEFKINTNNILLKNFENL